MVQQVISFRIKILDRDKKGKNMTYPKTIMDVHELEKKFRASGRNPNEYIFITTQLKVDIHEQHKNATKNTEEFKNRMRSSMQEVKELLKTRKTSNF